MKILLTGGAGFIGSHIAEMYCSHGFDVVVVDDLSTGKLANLAFDSSHHLKFVHEDIRDPEAMERVFDEYGPFDIVNHQAAHVSVSESMKSPVHDIETNIIGTLNVLSIARGCSKFIFSSSGGTVYGMHTTPRDESHPTEPLSIYGVSKLACEKLVKLKAGEMNFSYAILRYANVYGPKQTPHGEAGVVSIFLEKMLSDQVCTLYSGGQCSRDYIYVTDVVKANEICTLTPGANGIYNVSTGKTIRTKEVYSFLSEKLIEKSIVDSTKKELAPDRAGDIPYSCCIPGCIPSWKPEVDFERGLDNLLAYANCKEDVCVK
jgi:UDP-glucose 4-epimerase